MRKRIFPKGYLIKNYKNLDIVTEPHYKDKFLILLNAYGC